MLGPVVGVMGVLQALEAIRVIVAGDKREAPSMLLFSAKDGPQFRTVRLRPKCRKDCAVCSASATISEESLTEGLLDYVQFCGVPGGPAPLLPEERVSAQTLADAMKADEGVTPIILDVRDQTQFQLCSIKGSVNLPWQDIVGHSKDDTATKGRVLQTLGNTKNAFIVCRLGNDSQEAVQRFKDWGLSEDQGWNIRDVVGGLKAWRQEVDENFPDY